MRDSRGIPILACLVVGLGAYGVGGAIRNGDTGTAGEVGPAGVVAGADTLITRRVASTESWPWDVSPDGRYLIVHDWSTGNLALQDLVTGARSPLTDDARMASPVAASYAGPGVFSPDGERVAYAFVRQDCGQEVRVLDRRPGAKPQVVLPCTEDLVYTAPWDWTPDGAGLLVGFEEGDGARRLAILDVVDGSLRQIPPSDEGRGFFWRPPYFSWRPRISPDGRFVVYSATRPGSSGADLLALPVEGGDEIVFTRRSGDERLFGWEPDGSALLFYSEDGLQTGVYRLPLRGGRPAGEAELVRRSVWRAAPVGDSRDGFPYVVVVEDLQVQTASIDLMGGRQLTPFAPVEDPSLGASRGGAWSHDGRALAYVRSSANGGLRLVVVGLETGQTRDYPFPLAPGNSGSLMEWAPDGESLITYGDDPERGWGLYRIDLRSGSADPVLLSRDADLGSDWRALSLGPDGRRAVAANTGPDDSRIVAYDLGTGGSTVIAEASRVWRTAVSPDGETLAFWTESDPRGLHLVPMAGGVAERVVVEVGEGKEGEGSTPALPWGLTWTPDGRDLVFRLNGTLWRVSRAGGRATALATGAAAGGGFEHLRLSPDGSQVSLTGGAWRGEVWLLEQR